MRGGPTAPKDGYPEPDADGMYRLPVERSFRVTYTRSTGAVGSEFTLPTLAAGVDAKLESRFYDDLDIMPVPGGFVPVDAPFWNTARIAGAAGLACLGGGLVWWMRRRRPAPAAAAAAWTPARLTPLGVVTGLRRLETGLPRERAQTLREEIVLLELKCFGPGAAGASEEELREVVERWQS